MHKPLTNPPYDQPGPAWDVATLFPDQGHWSDADYLALTQGSNRLVELTDGHIEVLAMPKPAHQRIVAFVYQLMFAFVTQHRLGEALFAPLRVRLRSGKFREPDILFLRREHFDRRREDYWEAADLVVEVVSPDDESRQRDLATKRSDYAEAGVGEYWIIDPGEQCITVLTLSGSRYVTHAETLGSGRIDSAMLGGFSLEAADVFAAARGAV